MGRTAKEYWKWQEYTFPYSGEDWQKFSKIEKFLHDCARDCHEIRVTTDYPKPRKWGAHKVITHYHYFIKDPKIATYVLLKLS